MEQVIVTQILSYVMPLIVLVALAVLLSKTGSPWLIAALVAEVVSLLFRIAMEFGAHRLVESQLFMSAWQLCGLLFGVCLLGFAVTWQPQTSTRRGTP
ncbi:hypothetical protein [Tahibacter sp.]|uniref:hypothetical protein n=1 Tax=Tahibacter sp. TaxID=2056211 RepID=UPI0028C47C51|nr:hypothetical protein [Tahibacter sp.]